MAQDAVRLGDHGQELRAEFRPGDHEGRDGGEVDEGRWVA